MPTSNDFTRCRLLELPVEIRLLMYAYTRRSVTVYMRTTPEEAAQMITAENLDLPRPPPHCIRMMLTQVNDNITEDGESTIYQKPTIRSSVTQPLLSIWCHQEWY